MSRIVLTAAAGMVYTNGTDGGKVIYLAEGETSEGWREIPESEFIPSIEGAFYQVPVADQSEATDVDYQTALKEFGVVL